jgi:SH3 domain-containing YSC84-like protein 1
MSKEQNNTSMMIPSVTTPDVVVEDNTTTTTSTTSTDTGNIVTTPSSPSIQQLQPTIVPLPPRLNTTTGTTTTTTTQNVHSVEEGVVVVEDGTMNNNDTIIDTSNDAEIAAAFAAQEEQEYIQQQQQQQLLLRATTNMINTNMNINMNHDNPLLNTATSSNPTQVSSSSLPLLSSSSKSYSVATVSAPWQYDDDTNKCHSCHTEFHPLFNRKHHCRYCGYIFCHTCTKYKCLIPPSQIVLHPISGKKSKPITNYNHHQNDTTTTNSNHSISFTPNPDPDRMLTYITPNNSNDHDTTLEQHQQLLHGNGLEERILLAREPLRVCLTCYTTLQSIQDQLRYYNSNAMKYNYIDPTNPIQRFFNSPIANTLGHEIRKAAFTLNNLLPQPKRHTMNHNNNAFIAISDNPYNNEFHTDLQQCKDTCTTLLDSPNLQNLDGLHIPTKLLELAKGIAIITVLKGGFGFAGFEFGTGLVVARLPNTNTNPNPTTPTSDPTSMNINNSNNNTNTMFRWSAPSAIGTVGISWGALIGAQVSDHVFLLMTDEAVTLFYNQKASIQLGADIGIAVGPIGRSIEGGINMNGQQNTITAPIYTYSMSKGLYAGISLDGKVIVTRHDVNEKFYGMSISAEEILAGVVPTPPAAQPLYDALHRCHVYASMMESNHTTANTTNMNYHHYRIDHNPSSGVSSSTIPPPQQQFYPTNPSNTTMYESSSIQQEYGELLTNDTLLQQQQQHGGIYDYPLSYNNDNNNNNINNDITVVSSSSSTMTSNVSENETKK